MINIIYSMSIDELKCLLRVGKVWYYNGRFFTQQDYDLKEPYCLDWFYIKNDIEKRVSELEYSEYDEYGKSEWGYWPDLK